MNQIDMHKLLKTLGVLVLLFAMVGIATHFRRKNSMTLDDYAKLQSSQKTENEIADIINPAETESDSTDTEAKNGEDTPDTPVSPTDAPAVVSTLTGAMLNGGADGQAMLEQRICYPVDTGNAASADFYYEPLSSNLRRYITGISYPADAADIPDREDSDGAGQGDGISYDDLRYVHILHYNFEGVPVEGELICNASIAQNLVEIFHELYRNEYRIDNVLLPEEYDGDMTASAEDNNTFCFYGIWAEDAGKPGVHAQGLALDINPLYNPLVSYRENGSQNVSPAAAQQYADRDMDFAYKIDESDLCYKLFVKHGFVWGGNRNDGKDYGLFQWKDF